jgi:hypothetical protein
MHELIWQLSTPAPLWTLMELDWFATAQAAPFADRLHAVQCLPRLKLIAGSAHAGKNNHVWTLFKADRLRQGRASPLRAHRRVEKKAALEDWKPRPNVFRLLLICCPVH